MGVFDVDYNKVNEIEDLPYDVEITNHTWIETSDGTKLSAKLWQPKGLEVTRGTVLEFLPYRKDDFTALRDEIRHKYFAGNGFTSIRVDIRGTGDSEGIIEDEYHISEQDDAIDIISWIENQSWSNGSVGMIGKSWGGFNGLQVAARQPKALKTIISLCSTDDRYTDDVHYRGGVMMASDMLWWASTMFAYNARPPFPQFVGDRWYDMWIDRMENTPPFVEEWVSHQQRDEFWKHGSVGENYDDIQIPVLTMSGWADGYTDAVYRMMDNLNVPKKGIIGPWAHEFPDLAIPGPQIGYLQECVDWFSKWFTDDQSAVEHEDEFHIYIQDSVEPSTSYEYRAGNWIDVYAEKFESVDILSHFHDEIKLANNQHHGLYSGVYCPFGQEGDLAADQTIDNALATTISVDAAEELSIAGQAKLNVRVKSSHDEANLHVRLTDVHPNGKRTLITKGQLNLNHVNSHEHPEKLPIDEYIDAEIQFDVIGYTVPKGHSIEISFAPSYWPLMWASKDKVELTVDLNNSSLDLPYVENYTPVEMKYKTAEMATPLEKEIIEEGYRTRNVINDLTTNNWILDDYSNEGQRFLPHLGITYGTENHNIYTINNDNPLSASVQCDWTVVVEDADIKTEMKTESIMTCDYENFYLVNRLIGYKDGKEVFNKEWKKTVKRDFN